MKNKINQADFNLLKNADAVADFERAVEDARHYLLTDTDVFSVRVGDIIIKRVK